MPGFAFHRETLKQVADQMSASDPRGQLLNSPFASLGAMGPDILLYTPPSPGLAAALGDGTIVALAKEAASSPSSLSGSQLLLLEELFSNPLGAAYSVLFSLLVVPVWPKLSNITAVLAEANTIAQEEDEFAVLGLVDKLSSVATEANSLKTELPLIIASLTEIIGTITTLGPWMESAPLNQPGLPEPSDPRGCRPHEFLRWHGSGDFARALSEKATTPNQEAFALGWLCHLAGSVTAEPFVNNIVGGPYRTHWWRNRLAQNFIDSWVFGFAETPGQMTGDEPTPAYEAWESLCAANLQDAFNAGGLPGPASTGAVPSAVTAMATGNLGSLPQSFPSEIEDLLEDALQEIYPQPHTPEIRPELGTLAAQTFADAYVGAFGVFWFLTSGEGPLGNNLLESPPGGCGTTPPSWVSTGGSPTAQQAGLNIGGAVCAALLAILAVLLIVTGNVVAGFEALTAALAAPIIDWDEVRCNLFWITNMMLKQENLLRDALVFTGLAYPPPVLLGGPDLNGQTQPATDLTPDPNLDTTAKQPEGNVPPSSGIPLTRTNSFSSDTREYPRRLDEANGAPDLNFEAYPVSAGGETPSTENLIPPGKYPDFILNEAGLQNGGITTGGPYPTRELFLGDAVSNAAMLIDATELPNYNLDGDRGYGWRGWHPQVGTEPIDPPVHDAED
jgi:hypothetical protein